MASPNYEKLSLAARRLEKSMTEFNCYVKLSTIDNIHSKQTTIPFPLNWSVRTRKAYLYGCIVDLIFSKSDKGGTKGPALQMMSMITHHYPCHMQGWHLRVKLPNNEVILLLADTKMHRVALLIKNAPYWSLCFRPPNRPLPDKIHFLNKHLLENNILSEVERVNLEVSNKDEYIPTPIAKLTQKDDNKENASPQSNTKSVRVPPPTPKKPRLI